MADRRDPDSQFRDTGDGNAPVILLVDDEPAVRALAGKVLRDQGYEVLEAPDGAEALEVAGRRQGPIHLLVTDWVMPRLGGKELVRSLCVTRPQTAILIMSGYLDFEPPPKISVLPKPFRTGELVKMVREILARGSAPVNGSVNSGNCSVNHSQS